MPFAPSWFIFDLKPQRRKVREERSFISGIIRSSFIINVLLLYYILSFHYALIKPCQTISCIVLLKNVRNAMAKKTFSTRVEEESIRRLKHLAVDEDRSLGDLLAEAIDDLVRKSRKKDS